MFSKKIMLGVVVLGISSAVAVNSYAALPGFYLGGQLGWGKVHQANISRGDMNSILSSGLGTNNYTVNSFSSSGSDDGIAGRLYGGYQFNTNWAAELGWSKFKNMTTNAYSKATDNRTGSPVIASASGTVKTDAFDLVAKGIYPIQNNINVYGKFGLAYLTERANGSASVYERDVLSASGSGHQNEHKVYPTFGAGVSYDIAPNVAADVSWNRIQKVGGSKTLGSTDLVGVGLTYFIG
jgi:opacity protein-like surface antigen